MQNMQTRKLHTPKRKGQSLKLSLTGRGEVSLYKRVIPQLHANNNHSKGNQNE